MNHGNRKAGLGDAAASVIETSIRKVFPELDRRKRPPGERPAPMASQRRRRRSDRDGPR